MLPLPALIMPSLMKILLIHSHLNAGGITRYVLHLASELKRRGHQVWVASSGGEWEAKFKNNGIEIVKIPLKTKSIASPKILQSFFAVKRFLKTQKIDVIHAHNRVSQFLAFLVWVFMKIPYVSTFHGFYRPLFLRKLLKCEGVKTIAITQATADHIQDDLGVSADKVRVVYNGTTLKDFEVPRSPDKLKLKYGIEGSPVIGVMARLKPEKNHRLAIAAFSSLIRDYPNAVLLLPGEGSLKPELKEMVVKRGLEKSVRFLGTVEPVDIYTIMDIFLHPASSEGFGLAIIEAQTIGVPVIASNIGGIKEIIIDEVTGLLLKDCHDDKELYEKIKRLLNDPELCQRMVTKAKQRVHDIFSISKMTDGTLKVYQEVLDETARRN
jgi:glycosyltransferase involved in cell wall biosynthesis